MNSKFNENDENFLEIIYDEFAELFNKFFIGFFPQFLCIEDGMQRSANDPL